MIEENKLRTLIREEIVKNTFGSPLVEEVNYDLNGILTESQQIDIEETLIEEGIGRAIVKGWTTLMGAGVGAGLGSWIAILGGLIGMVTPIGMIAGAAAGSIGMVYFAYQGGKVGLRAGRHITKSDSAQYAKKLRESIDKRDELLEEVPDAKDKEAAEKLGKKIDKYTEEQKQLSRKLQQSAKKDFQKDIIDNSEYKELNNIAKAASKGKLSYLVKKK